MGKKRVGVDQLFFRYLLVLFFEKFLISVSFFKIMVVVLCVLSFPLLAFFSEYGTVICHFTLHNLLENLLRGNREVLTTHRLTTKKTS